LPEKSGTPGKQGGFAAFYAFGKQMTVRSLQPGT
jgi:hypothetical protein